MGWLEKMLNRKAQNKKNSQLFPKLTLALSH